MWGEEGGGRGWSARGGEWDDVVQPEKEPVKEAVRITEIAAE